MATQAQAKPAARYVELITDSFGFIANKHGDHTQVKRFTWKNSNRIQVQAITYGATVVSIRYPNKKGIIEDVVLGFEDLQSYIEYNSFNFGATIGRHANYVKNSLFNINRKDYILTANMGKHHVNGGKRGFNQIVWNYNVSGNKVTLSYLSPDGEEGYPGDCLVCAIMELSSQNEFRIEYKAMSTKPTIVNIANHIYFNLAGHSAGNAEMSKHNLMLNADCHTTTGEDMLPTGEIQSVLNTIYDFQSPVKLGPLLEKVDGYNNNFCINRGIDQGVNFIGRLCHPPSGRILEIYSNQYGVQFDTANTLPAKDEPEDTVTQKTAKCPYLRSGVTTFDMLDEIYNKIAEIKTGDTSNDYDEVLALVQDMMKKQGTAYKNSMSPDGNSAVKRSSLTIENLSVFQLTPIQIKYIERIQKGLEPLKESSHIDPLKSVLSDCVHNNKLFQETMAGQDKRKGEDKTMRGKKGCKYGRHGAVCLQCQNYPDAANNSKFPSPILKPGQQYSHIVIYKFWIKTDQSGITGIL